MYKFEFPAQTNLYTGLLVVDIGNKQKFLSEGDWLVLYESKKLANSQRKIAMSSLKVFADMMSQPSRSVVMLLKANEVPFTLKIINIAEGKLPSPENNWRLFYKGRYLGGVE